MHDLPSVPVLLALAHEMLMNELAPLLPEELHADARLLADAMAIAGRVAEAADESMRAILHELEEFYRNSLTHPALWAGSPLSRTAGEGAERSEAGEGVRRRRPLRARPLAGAGRVRQEEFAVTTTR